MTGNTRRPDDVVHRGGEREIQVTSVAAMAGFPEAADGFIQPKPCLTSFRLRCLMP
jgi:hypothetical protein